MAVVYAVQSGDWSDTATWDGGVVPTSGDDVYANGFDVTFDVSVAAVNKISNDDSEGHDFGGSFIVVNGSLTLSFNEFAHQNDSLIKMEGACDVTLDGIVTTGSSVFGDAAITVSTYDQISDTMKTSNLQVTGLHHSAVDYDYPGIFVDNNGTLNLDILGDCYGKGRCILVSHGAELNLTIGGDLYAEGSVDGSSWKGLILFDHGPGDPADGHTINIGGDVYFGPGVDNEVGFVFCRQTADLDIQIDGDLAGNDESDTFGIWLDNDDPCDLTLTVGGEIVGGGDSTMSLIRAYKGDHVITAVGGIYGGSKPGEATIKMASSGITGSLTVVAPFLHGENGNIIYAGDSLVLDVTTSSIIGGSGVDRPAILFGNGSIVSDVIKAGSGEYSVGIAVSMDDAITQSIVIETKTVEALDNRPAIAAMGVASGFVMGTSTLDVIVENTLISAPDGTFPISTWGTLKVNDKSVNTSNWTLPTVSDETTILTNATGSGTSDVPLPRDVRKGLVYGEGEFTGELAVPTPEQVSFGVPVDNTIGQTALDLPQVVDYFGEQIKAAFNIEPHVCPPCPPSTGSGGEGWLPLPTLSPGDQKFAMLAAVYEGEVNSFAFKVSGNYTVDWGDGSTQNYMAGTLAYHEYSYTGLPTETLTNEGFRQAVIQVTPQAGQNLTSFVFGEIDQYGIAIAYNNSVKDMICASPHCSEFRLNNSDPMSSDLPGPVFTADLVRFKWVGTSSLTSLVFAFAFFSSLREIDLGDMTANVTDFSYAFAYDVALVKITNLKTQSAENLGFMFGMCTSLRTSPEMDLQNVEYMSNTFFMCGAITTTPEYDMANVIDASYMFYGCTNLKTVNLVNTDSISNASYMFSDCSNLETSPVLDLSAVTDAKGMFSKCYRLTAVQPYNLGSCYDFVGMFNGCLSLVTIPNIDTSEGQYFREMFYGCTNLKTVYPLDVANGVLFDHIFLSCPALESAPLMGTSRQISYQNCNLSASALNAIYTNLATVDYDVISVNGNPGVDSDTPSIATAKGWTVTGT